MEQQFRPVLTIRIFADEKCFGPGIAVLLQKVQELHSLRAAAMSIGMAYSIFALEPFFELLPILLPRIARIIVINRFNKNFIDKGLLPGTPIQIKNGRG